MPGTLTQQIGAAIVALIVSPFAYLLLVTAPRAWIHEQLHMRYRHDDYKPWCTTCRQQIALDRYRPDGQKVFPPVA